jgi:hypothetical protein
MSATEQLATPRTVELDPAPAPRGLRRLLEEECFILLALSLTLTAVVIAAPASMIVPDTWLALVDGRWIVEHGLPHADHLTLWTAGVHWVDQQWLGQLVFYGVGALGGIRLCVAFALVLDAVALGGAVFAARRLGASTSSTALAALIPVVVGPWLLQARTQSLALPLFVGVYALVAADSRRPTRWAYLAIPLLALWANIHGSASLGAGVLFLHGVVLLVQRQLRGAVFAVAGPLALLASPYGVGLVGYYHTMLLGSTLRHYVLEWGPTHLDSGTAPFFAIALLSMYLLGRRGAAVSALERVALPLFVLLGVLAARNTIWIGLAAAVTLPTLVDGTLGPPLVLTRGMRRLNVGLSTFVTALAVFVAVAMLTRPESALLTNYPSSGAAAVAAAAGPSGRVLADDTHSNWLMWKEPQLIGRVAYDVRFELFKRPQLARLQAFHSGRAPSVADGYRVVTFGDAPTAKRLVPHGRIVFRDSRFAVLATR